MVVLRINAILIMMLTAACASAPDRIKVGELSSAADSVAFTLVDARPEGHSRSVKLEGRDAVYGDDEIVPPPLSLVRSALTRNLGKSLEGNVVRLEKFRVSAERVHGSSGSYRSSSSGPTPVLAVAAAGKALGDELNAPFRIATDLVVEIDGIRIEHFERDLVSANALEAEIPTNRFRPT